MVLNVIQNRFLVNEMLELFVSTSADIDVNRDQSSKSMGKTYHIFAKTINKNGKREKTTVEFPNFSTHTYFFIFFLIIS